MPSEAQNHTNRFTKEHKEMTNANDLLMGSGIPAAKFPTIGTAISGRIVREPEAREQTDFTTGAVLRWDNGEAKMQIVVHLATDQRDPQDLSDDGTRALYIKGQMLNAVRGAVRAAGAPGLAVGGTLTITYAGDAEPTKRGFNGAKQYTATYTPPAQAAVANVLNAGDTPASGNGTTAPAGQPPAGVDPAVWAALGTEQRAAVLAATAGTR